ncbi:MAG: hypothetical protein V9G04_02630 [Nocardioides sp.]
MSSDAPQEDDMTEGTNESIADGIGTYDVVLLIENELTAADARQVHSLHEEIADEVVYHVLIPYDDAASRIEASMGSLAAGEIMASPAMMMDPEDLEAIRHDSEEQAEQERDTTLNALRSTGATVNGEIVHDDPIDALATKVKQVDGREAIILTRSHVVSEFFHVDWTSRARRRLGVPVLHLLERENFDEQAGHGEGVTGL